VTEAQGGFGGYGGYGASRFDSATSFGSNYTTPGWQRAQGKKSGGGFAENGARYTDDSQNGSHDGFDDASSPSPWRARNEAGGSRRLPLTIEGELVAKSTGTVSDFTLGDRVFHQKFGNGNVTAIDGNKLTIQFDRAGEKRVVDSFVERV
jgi:DNA helicase-2/ATP-dependent DNA helicase PcrA